MRFVLLALLTVVTLLVFWWIQPENSLDIDQDVFQVDNIESLSRVELTSPNGSVDLAFDGSRWRVNDHYDADRNMISVLFATLQQSRPKRAVAGTKADSVYRQLMDSGVKVSLYEGEDLRETFYAGGNQQKTQSFFADPDTQEVYVMAIPGYRVYVSGILELPESGWRDKFVFGFNWRNFKSLEASFDKAPSENFTVSMVKDYFGIEGLASVDTARLNTFLDDVSLLTVDEYVSEPGLVDSLLQLKPDFQIRVTDVANRVYRLRLFNSKRLSVVYGIIQDGDAALFDRKKIQRLLKPKSFFKKK
jgi:hypothetical protein